MGLTSDFVQQPTATASKGGISGLVVEYNVAIVVTRVRFPADARVFYLFFPDA